MENGMKFARCCDECGKGMMEGFVIGAGMEHYCSTKCLYENHSPQDYFEMYDDGEGDSYYTAWEDEEDLEWIVKDGKCVPIQ